MAGGVAINVAGGDVNGRLTKEVILTCLVAASGGLLFGYDIGITGGVTTMKPFLEKFFPEVLRQAGDAKTTIYCVYDSHILSAFTSSLYIAGFVTSMMASGFTSSYGRKFTMMLGALTFLVGGILTGAATHVSMLLIGRIFLGFGLGFNNQATPLYLSEMAPSKWRGAFNTGFQLFIGFGNVISAAINYYAKNFEWGWRLSLGFAAIPAFFMMIGILFIAESPSSLVERGMLEQAKDTLIRIRGHSEVDGELNELIMATEIANATKGQPILTVFRREYRPHLVMSIAIPFFQQVGGICIIAFYAPTILSSLGSGHEPALMGAIILGLVNIFSILVSTYAVDRCGRRILFLQGGVQMFIPMLVMAILLEVTVDPAGIRPISQHAAVLMLIMMCVYAAGFGWSWGPLSWIIPSEIFPLKIRAIGQSISVAINFATTFLLSQTFLNMLCKFRYGAFLFFATWIFIMTVFVALLLPETKGINMDSMDCIWQRHWFWKRYVPQLPSSQMDQKEDDN